jgi:cardiolipin synthase
MSYASGVPRMRAGSACSVCRYGRSVRFEIDLGRHPARILAVMPVHNKNALGGVARGRGSLARSVDAEFAGYRCKLRRGGFPSKAIVPLYGGHRGAVSAGGLRVSEALPPIWPPFADMRVGAHRLSLLKDGGQTFAAMLASIAAARHTICLETYILHGDRTGRRFAEALAERARAGVEVNLLYDAWGSSVPASMLEMLHHAGVRTLAFHPLRFSGRHRELIGRLTRRDHKKSLIVDSCVAYTGGVNISDDYAAVEEGGAGWRDTHLRIEGPAALELEYFFLTTWRRGGGLPVDGHRYGGHGRRPDPQVTVITSDLRGGRLGIREAYREAITSAKKRIFITNAYFLPSLRFIHELTEAARRGVDVRIMIAGTTDVRAVLYACRSIYEVLLGAGVRMFEWRGRVLHAKTAVIDGRWSTVGSSNLDYQSLRHNLEANAIVESGRFAAALEAMFYADLEHCEEIVPERWLKRPIWARAASLGAYLLRDWL